LLSLLHRITCPDPETLVNYQERRLAGTERLVIARHIAECPLCAEELHILNSIDAVPLESTPSLGRRLIEAIFQSPLQLPQPVRGTILHYRALDLLIHLIVRKMPDQSGLWLIRGQIRTLEGQLVLEQIERVTLRTLNDPEETLQETDIESGSSFNFGELPTGLYTLTVFTADTEIVIPELLIGDEA
jgi:hypothetical protein